MSDITQEDREREPFRWCVYCDADCDLVEPEHSPECPSSTGVYQVKYEGRAFGSLVLRSGALVVSGPFASNVEP